MNPYHNPHNHNSQNRPFSHQAPPQGAGAANQNAGAPAYVVPQMPFGFVTMPVGQHNPPFPAAPGPLVSNTQGIYALPPTAQPALPHQPYMIGLPTYMPGHAVAPPQLQIHHPNATAVAPTHPRHDSGSIPQSGMYIFFDPRAAPAQMLMQQRPATALPPSVVPPQAPTTVQSVKNTAAMPSRPPHDVSVWGFAVVDQLHSILPRVPIAPSAIEERTRGIDEYNNDVVTSSTRPCNSSVCLLFSNTARCDSGKECRAFHVKREYVELSRQTSAPLCCALHNCFYSQEMLFSGCAEHVSKQRYFVALSPLQSSPTAEQRLVEISILHISMTVGLDTLPVKDGCRIISNRRHVCRLHLRGKCKWTKDCGHIHICRSLYILLESADYLAFLDSLQSGVEDSEALYGYIARSNDLQHYMQSLPVLPMVTQLLNMNRVEALKALVRARVICVQSQMEALLAANIITSPSDVSVVEVSHKLLSFLKPNVPTD